MKVGCLALSLQDLVQRCVFLRGSHSGSPVVKNFAAGQVLWKKLLQEGGLFLSEIRSYQDRHFLPCENFLGKVDGTPPVRGTLSSALTNQGRLDAKLVIYITEVESSFIAKPVL